MGLFQKAYETYEYHSHLAGCLNLSKEPLAPVAHIITFSHIEIVLDSEGRFVRALTVGKDEPKIIIPVTEKSSGRTSTTIAPHPLCDQIGYISPANIKKHDAYVKQLEDWEQSSFTHAMLKPILTYAKGKTINFDLAKAGINNSDEKKVVRWTVIGLSSEDSENCWKNISLFESFTRYYESKKSADAQVLCMVTGKTTAEAQQHLKGIISINGNAKLISANDTSNFTYRGRFKTDDQAVTVGFEASQKAHNALKWLAADQGVNISGRTFLCWNPQGKKLPPVRSPLKRKNDNSVFEIEYYKKDLSDTLHSFKSNFNPSDEAVIAVFDAATTGRLAVTYYNELFVHDFLENLEYWDTTCCFRHSHFGISSPSLERIIHCAFGTERNGKIEADERVVKQQMQRLLICRVDRTNMPYDIVHAISKKTMNPLAYKAEVRDTLQFTACAVIRKYYIDHKSEEYQMALEKDKNDISYQYGRLLAVLEKAERDTYASSESRDPNAIRMQSVFCIRPAQTAKTVIEQLKKAYLPRLSVGLRTYYDRMIGEIYEKISAYPETLWNAPLKETYIMGYYLQKNTLYTKNNEINTTEDNENE